MAVRLRDAGAALAGRLFDVVCGDRDDLAFLTWLRPARPLRARIVAELLDVAPAGRGQPPSVGPGGGRLSAEYARILSDCRAVRGALTGEDAVKAGKYRDLLRTTRKIIDPATGEPREVTDDGPMVRAYREKHAAYLTAGMRYRACRLAAAAGDAPASD